MVVTSVFPVLLSLLLTKAQVIAQEGTAVVEIKLLLVVTLLPAKSFPKITAAPLTGN